MMHPYLDSGVAIRKEEHGKKTEKSIFSLVEPSSSYNKNDRIKKIKYNHFIIGFKSLNETLPGVPYKGQVSLTPTPHSPTAEQN